MRAERERQERFIDLVQEHQGAILKIAALYARSPEDREDLSQEIVLQLWRSFDAFRGEASFSTFLYRVALNTALMGLRRRYRRREVDASLVLDEVAAPPREDRDEDVERLHGAIRQLAPLDRAIVLLYLEERTYEEIAAITGLSKGNVSVRLVRVRDRLRRLMGLTEGQKEETPCPTK